MIVARFVRIESRERVGIVINDADWRYGSLEHCGIGEFGSPGWVPRWPRRCSSRRTSQHPARQASHSRDRGAAFVWPKYSHRPQRSARPTTGPAGWGAARVDANVLAAGLRSGAGICSIGARPSGRVMGPHLGATSPPPTQSEKDAQELRWRAANCLQRFSRVPIKHPGGADITPALS